MLISVSVRDMNLQSLGNVEKYLEDEVDHFMCTPLTKILTSQEKFVFILSMDRLNGLKIKNFIDQSNLIAEYMG